LDNQNEDSSEVKTHEEIMKLYKDLQSVEAKVKNPEQLKKESIEPEIIIQKIEPSLQKPEVPIQEQQPIEPTGEMPLKEKEKPKRPFLEKIDEPEIPSEKKTHWFAFFKKEKTDDSELKPDPEVEQQPQEIKISRSTFILQLDDAGNLIGFPMKKTQQGTEESEGEPVKGIKGKLIQIASMFRRKKSEESESSGGISEKIKGIFRRKNKE
jgi:hypothetical protein